MFAEFNLRFLLNYVILCYFIYQFEIFQLAIKIFRIIQGTEDIERLKALDSIFSIVLRSKLI